MLTFDKKSLKKLTIQSTTAHQYSTYKTVSSNSYLTSPSNHNGTTSDKFINTTYEVYAPSIENEREDYARKYGEESLNIKHNMSTNQTLKQHV